MLRGTTLRFGLEQSHQPLLDAEAVVYYSMFFPNLSGDKWQLLLERLVEDKVKAVVVGSGFWVAPEDYMTAILPSQIDQLRSLASLDHVVLVGYPHHVRPERILFFKELVESSPDGPPQEGKHRTSFIDMPNLSESPWPDGKIDWRTRAADITTIADSTTTMDKEEESGATTELKLRHFERNTHKTSIGEPIYDAHYKWGVEPMITDSDQATGIKCPPNHDCRDMFNLNVVQMILKPVFPDR